MPNYGPKYIGARASTIAEKDRYRADGTDEWFTTEDGYPFQIGNLVYDYYDCRWVTVESLNDWGGDGWFSVKDKDGRGGTLNSVRMSLFKPER